MPPDPNADSDLERKTAFIDKIIAFPNDETYERLKPLTDLRKDPGEARILYTCRRVRASSNNPRNNDSISTATSSSSNNAPGQEPVQKTDDNNNPKDEEEFVLKIKAQWPGPQNLVHAGPSPNTLAELAALEKFANLTLPGVPHLITWKKAVQPSAEGADEAQGAVHPGGYVIYTVMTKMPGRNLYDLGYWSLPPQKRAVIQRKFLAALGAIRAVAGVAPFDCALRNVLWFEGDGRDGGDDCRDSGEGAEDEDGTLSIVDFEHYRSVELGATIDDGEQELQRWGLAQRPPPRTWHAEWARGH